MQTISVLRKWLAVGAVLSFVVMSTIPTTGNVAVSKRMNTGDLRGAPPDEEWNRTYSAHPPMDRSGGNCIKVTPDGGYIITGYTGGDGYYPLYLLNVDKNGNELWNRTFGGEYNSGNWVEVTSDNGYIITGRHDTFTGSFDGCFAFDVYPGYNSVWFDPDNPGVLNYIGPNTAPDFISGGCFAHNVWYAVCFSGGLYTVDYTTGEMTLIGGTTPLFGIGYDDLSNTMYGCDSSDLYKVDMTTGATTLIGPFNITGGLMIDMTIDAVGNAYGHDIASDAIYKIDLSTGAATLIGQTGIDCNYAQGMGFDKDTGILYLAAYTTEGGLYTVDVNTGHATLVGNFQGGDEVDGLAIPYGMGETDEVWLIKTDAYGNEEWNKTFGGSNFWVGNCVKQTMDGGYILTGGYWGGYPSVDNILVMKTDALGNELWCKTYGNRSRGYSITLATDGGYVVSGDINRSLGLMKIDENGTVEWVREYSHVNGREIQRTSDGGYIVAGGTSNESGNGLLLMKTDGNGVEQWNRTFYGSGGGYTVIQTVNGDYILGGSPFRLVRVHPDGSVVWDQSYLSSQNPQCYCVQQTSDNGFIGTGSVNKGSGSRCVVLKLNADDNHPPSSSPIAGPALGLIDTNYSFCFNTTDLDGDPLYCTWDWGDGGSSDWLGPYPSNGTICASHAWSQNGTYTIHVTLKDRFGHESTPSPSQVFYAGELRHAFLIGRYTNMTSEDEYRIIDAVNLRMILFRPLHYVHYERGEKVTFSTNTSRAFITRHFIVGRVDALT